MRNLERSITLEELNKTIKLLPSGKTYGGTFVSLLFNQKKNQFNQKKHFQKKIQFNLKKHFQSIFFEIQSKKTFSIKEKKCLNAKKNLRPKKLHLNTFFL